MVHQGVFEILKMKWESISTYTETTGMNYDFPGKTGMNGDPTCTHQLASALEAMMSTRNALLLGLLAQFPLHFSLLFVMGLTEPHLKRSQYLRM